MKSKANLLPACLAAAAILLSTACDKKENTASQPSSASPSVTPTAPTNVAPATAPTVAAAVDKTAVPGIDTASLSPNQQDTFFGAVDSLPSPCGKAHSLRTSISTDKECIRAPFAARYVFALVEEGAPANIVKESFEAHYIAPRLVFQFVKQAPLVGSGSAVTLVEFFDYACSHCQQFSGELDAVIKQFPTDLTVVFKNFPLPNNIDSPMAARAALAADRQGKFMQMHKLLFQNAPKHKRNDVLDYAKSLGLDMSKFEKDLDALSPRVEADKAEGNTADFPGTPAIFLNGRRYIGPPMAKFLALWIEEEIAMVKNAGAAK